MSIHDGHRKRMKDRFIDQGLDSFTEIQILEFLLFYCIPRQDTNELAHRLLEHFGSFSKVLDAEIHDMMKVKGIGENTAVFLKLLPAVARTYHVNKACLANKPLTEIEDCGSYMMPFFYGRCNETVYLLCLDAKGKAICCKKVGEGSINSAGVPIRRIVELALAAKASSVVLAHNHPSGSAVPSGEDLSTTHRVAVALDAVDVVLADHLIFAEGDYVSMVLSGSYRPGMLW